MPNSEPVMALLEGSLLVDGFVGAKWKIVQEPGRALLRVQPFAALSKRVRAAISDEGVELLRFALPAAEIQEICFTKPIG